MIGPYHGNKYLAGLCCLWWSAFLVVSLPGGVVAVTRPVEMSV